MYKLLIILRYLRRKLTPMFAALAVTLCSAMVIIVISVMGGFLRKMEASVQTLEGQVIVDGDVVGFPHYERMVQELERLPQVHAATAIIKAFGLVNIPDMDRGSVYTVEVVGVDPASFDRVVSYSSTLHWRTEDLLEALDWTIGPRPGPASEQAQAYQLLRQRYGQTDPQAMGMSLTSGGAWPQGRGMVLGIHVSHANTRDEKGRYDILNNRTLGRPATLTLLPVTSKGAILEPAARRLVVVNEFKSGLYAIDANRVFVPFDVAQKMLRMDAYEEVDAQTGRATGRKVPGRCSTLLVRGAPGLSAEAVKEAVVQRLGQLLLEEPDLQAYPLRAFTWRERHATFLGAVEREKFLVTILFAVISIVAVVMIGVIFHMIVLEKTRDIGALRALGASQSGVAGVFLGYGLAVGVVGVFLGFWLAAAVVWNINQIQDWLTRVFGLTIWSPEVYYFDYVPNRMDLVEVTVILAAALAASVAGAVIPALRAAVLDPVEALRYE